MVGIQRLPAFSLRIGQDALRFIRAGPMLTRQGGDPMTSPGMMEGSPWSSDEIGPLLDCLSRLDGKLRVIADRDGRVLTSSADALDDAGGNAAQMLELAAIQLSLSDAASRLLAVRGHDTAIAMVPPSPAGPSLIIRAAAVDADHVCLVMAMPGQTAPGRIGELQALFALTPCEAQIVVDLMQGLPPQTIARNRNNSIHTIRAHIRQCHHKIGVNSREGLFRKIAIACV